MKTAPVHTQQLCAHCGDRCTLDATAKDDRFFCCHGCELVYTMLHDSGMGDYYRYESTPGISQRLISESSFDYLDDEEIIKSMVIFRESGIARVSFVLPQIHCSACLWLLEHLSDLHSGIIKSVVNFQSKEAAISYRETDISLRRLVELLTQIGYGPNIRYDHGEKRDTTSEYDKRLMYKLGLAGFSFGNIMLLSFPEYLGFAKASYLFYIGYMNILLAIPVLLYSGSEYLKSAWVGLRRGSLNIDLPIAMGMLALFGRSLYDILSHTGEGYLDSFAGFVFFLLIGRWFQSYTYHALDFDRTYKSYFPISATARSGPEWKSKSLDRIVVGDILMIRNQELVPADGILIKGRARLDYSFVTGESRIVAKEVGAEIYAGAKHQGDSIEIEVTKKVNQSYLTQLWNEDTFHSREESGTSRMLGIVSRYFTIAVIIIATMTLLYWYVADSGMAVTAFTSVLIVACPCALALAIPFTYGNILRLLARRGIYLRNVQTISQMQDIDTIIFDKTGTITDSKNIDIHYEGHGMDDRLLRLVKSACHQSSHPLSKAIVRHLDQVDILDVDAYVDVVGQGIQCVVDGMVVRLGSENYIFGTADHSQETSVFLEVGGTYYGRFIFEHALRTRVPELFGLLKERYEIAVISGDNNGEAARMQSLIGAKSEIYFNQSPSDKLQKIKDLQSAGHRVMMIGDGLNDAGALRQAEVGFVVSDAENNFSPSCDGIVEAERFSDIYLVLRYVTYARYIIYGAFLLAFAYNGIGLYYAVGGRLSPVIAAILMPLSSISVVVYGVVTSWLMYRYAFRRYA